MKVVADSCVLAVYFPNIRAQNFTDVISARLPGRSSGKHKDDHLFNFLSQQIRPKHEIVDILRLGSDFDETNCTATREFVKLISQFLALSKHITKEKKNRNSESDETAEPGFLDVILSPQQKRILNTASPAVMIHGEPGSGKTLLLIQKAIEAAQGETIKTVTSGLFRFRP